MALSRSQTGIPQQDQGIGEQSPTSLTEITTARKRAAVSVSLNLSLAVGKGVAGIIAGSSALLSDAIHSGTDVIASIAAYIGLWLAGRQHPSFPYGLYKAETVATLLTSAAIILAGYEIVRRALLGPDILPNVSIALPVALASLLVAFGFGFYQLRTGRRLHSPALVADARDYLVDGCSTGVVVLSLIGATFGLHLDRWAAGVVAVFIFWSGGQLLWQALRDLLDEAIDRGTERRIISMVESHPRVEKVERCLSRTAGGRFIVDLDVVLRTHSHELADRISSWLEHEVRREFPRVVMARIRARSHQSDEIRRLTPVEKPGGSRAVHLARAPWFLLETIDRSSNKTVGQEYVENLHWNEERKRGFLVGQWLLKFKPDQILVAEKKEGTAVALLKEAGVEVILTEDSTIKAER